MQHNGYNKFITTIHSIILQIKMNRFLFISFFLNMSIEKRLEINLFKNIIGYDIRCDIFGNDL